MKRKSISAFFPALNEEDSIAKLTHDLLKVLQSKFEQYEVIIINDGSTDRTAEIADEICMRNDGHVKAIHHAQSNGYGNALKAGFKAARNDLVFFTDGDYQFDMNDLYTALRLIDGYDIITGYRKNRQDSQRRIWLSKGYNYLIRVLFGLKLKDIDCSFKLFKKTALEKISLESDGYFIDTELIIKSQTHSLKIKEFAVKHLPRTSGVSKVKLKHIFITLHEIVKLWKTLK